MMKKTEEEIRSLEISLISSESKKEEIIQDLLDIPQRIESFRRTKEDLHSECSALNVTLSQNLDQQKIYLNQMSMIELKLSKIAK